MKYEFDITTKNFAIVAVILFILCIVAIFANVVMNDKIQTQSKISDLETQLNNLKPTATSTPPLPTSITFTALSSSVSTGQYQVYTTDGKNIIFSNYASWNEIYPRETYVADVTIQNGIYYTNGATRISRYGYSYDDYGYYNDRYYNDRYNRYYQDRAEWTPNGEKCIFAHCG